MSGIRSAKTFDCRAPSKSGQKIPFAYHCESGRYVDATMVSSGADCGCTCPGCGDPVVARHRRKRNTPHFSHHTGAECPGAFETSLHQAAKQVMAELNEIALPPSDWGPMPVFRFFATHAEYRLRSFIPDVLATDFEEHRLAIEIRVTHEVDLAKQEKIKAMALDCIEFDLSKVSRQLTYESLVADFQTNALKCHWVYHHGVRMWQAEIARLAAETITEAERQAKLDQIFHENFMKERQQMELKQTEKSRWDKWGSKMPWARG